MGDFKVKFDMLSYKRAGILPDLSEYLKHDELLNYDEYDKGNVDLCFWKRQETPLIITNDYIEREVTRILRTGVWICIKDVIAWIPPNYYLFLQYFTTGGAAPQFRLKRLKHVYHKIAVRNNPRALGTYTIKNRQDGETTIAMSDCLWEAADGNMDFGQMGMQSKTRDTVQLSCWRTLIMGWNVIPRWLKDAIFYDFISGDKVAETMKFVRQAEEGDQGRNVLISYGASTHNAFDSFNNMRRCILDEVNKWEECSFYATFLNYEKFIAAGSSRKGLFDIFSSPADKSGKWNDEALTFWKGSDPDNLNDEGTTDTRIFRYYSDPLEGIEGFYDKFGDADSEAILAWIMAKRKSRPKEHLMGEIRAYPLSESEMFGSADDVSPWSNHSGLLERKIYLMSNRFKDQKTQEPMVVYGNLERVDGYIDGDVEFRMSDKQQFDLKEARFCFSYVPKKKQPLKSIFHPPDYIEGCLGLDPFNMRYEAKNKSKQSNGALVNRVFRDLYERGYNKCPTMIYCCRPPHQETFFEDALKAAIFNRSLIQYENRSDKFANYAEDRGYFDWLLPEIGASASSKRKGDAPSGGGKNAFLEEAMGLLNANTNTPRTQSDPYYLEYNWFVDLIEDYLAFNPLDTHANDLTMADFQALLGGVKIMYKKIRQPSTLTGEVFGYLLS